MSTSASASSPFGVPTAFDLKTQTSHDFEGGIRANAGPLSWQTSVYYMELENELHFSPATFTNTNLDPTLRYGVENILTWRVADNLRLKGGLAYTRSKFREGPFAGNDVPLVSPWTGERGRIMGHLPEISGARRGRALLQRAPHGQRPERISSR